MNSISLHSQQVKQFSRLELIAKQVVEGFITGLHKSPFHGFSVEFAEHRLYNTGESTRHIDWKLFARTEKLFVKRFEEETNLRCQVVIDTSSSMYFPQKENDSQLDVNKIGFSTYAAASIIHLLKKQRDAFGLTLFSDKVDLHTDARSTVAQSKLVFNQLDELLKPRPKEILKQSSAAQALHEIADKIKRRSLVIIFSDMMENSDREQDDLWNALQHLKHNKHEVILFHVADRKKELDLDFENRPYRFVDMETGEELKLNPLEVREAYQHSMKEFERDLKLKCGQYSIDLVQADIEKGFDQVLLPYLLKRKKMY
ncbi:MAG: DUF58 domain-containing protein [Flavobacteriales bacterium]|nr:DUF58 domain-containing protein [Flavobacteriales bacterium]